MHSCLLTVLDTFAPMSQVMALIIESLTAYRHGLVFRNLFSHTYLKYLKYRVRTIPLTKHYANNFATHYLLFMITFTVALLWHLMV